MIPEGSACDGCGHIEGFTRRELDLARAGAAHDAERGARKGLSTGDAPDDATQPASSVAPVGQAPIAPARQDSGARAERPNAGVHRVHGEIRGKFVPASTTVVAGEPIVITLEATANVAELPVSIAGDSRNSPGFPTRVAVKAVDAASGGLVCDNVASPPFPSFGGIGYEKLLAKGESLREEFVLNPACPGLGKPGVYRVTLHRRLTNSQMTIKKPGSAYPTSCDVHPLHEGPAAKVIASEPACVKQLDEAPSITSELELRVEPFDAKALRERAELRLKEADETGRHRIGRWLCAWVACSCPQGSPPPDADLLASLPRALPASFPKACP